MNIKNIIEKFLSYTPKSDYEFLLEDSIKETYDKSSNCSTENSKISKIFSSLNINKEYLKTLYNLSINSDIILREFSITINKKSYNSFLIYIDGMIDSKLMDEFVLQPLMKQSHLNIFDNKRIYSEVITNNITIRKVRKFNLPNYLLNCLLPQNTINKIFYFSEVTDAINSGNCVLFIESLDLAFDIEVKGFNQRNVDTPKNEVVIKGPHEAFVENLRTNTSMIRRIINNENLIIENLEVGNLTKTKCAICYLNNIANSNLVNEVKYRLSNLDIDSLISAGDLEELISDSNILGVPEILSTERPDKVSKYLLHGRVAILVNGTPYGLIVPTVLIDFLSSSEDSNLNVRFGNFLRILRVFAALITLLLPGLYVAITSFYQEILPTNLLFSILASRENVPFPIIVEILIMEFSFELIREAGLRVPSPIGPTIGIVGALVLGQAAVSASIVSPILIIIVAITGISSFAIPDFSFGFHLRYFRFFFIILGFMAGFLGIALGLFVYIATICNLKSFGIYFAIPLASFNKTKGHSYLLPPIWKRENRASYIFPKKEKEQSKISMKWKYKQNSNIKE